MSVVLGKNSGEKHLEIMSEWMRVLCRQLEYVPQDFFRTLLCRVCVPRQLRPVFVAVCHVRCSG